MRILNANIFTEPRETKVGAQILGFFDLELDTGITARQLRLVRDKADQKVVWSRRFNREPTVDFDDDGRAAVLSLVDRSISLGQYRAVA